MRIIFIRHAEAIERADGLADEQRFLTPEGRFIFRKTSKTLREEGIDPNLILSSPYLRAMQTADILAERLDYVGSLLPSEELAPGFDGDALQRLITAYKSVKELVIIGHEPDLSSIITDLLSLPEGFTMTKGAALKICIATDDSGKPAQFKWMAAGKKLITSVKKLVPEATK
jgi:phosphohistidine phosphatase